MKAMTQAERYRYITYTGIIGAIFARDVLMEVEMSKEQRSYINKAVLLIFIMLGDFGLAIFLGLSMGILPELWNIPHVELVAPVLISMSFVPVAFIMLLARNIGLVASGKQPKGFFSWPESH